ncbi:MAG: hypothetical protein JXL97_18940 [Bacteroidales bacterium]|nr:hypothetical protein [Bacteroidales bacterium]
MKSILFLTLTFFLFLSCGTEVNEDTHAAFWVEKLSDSLTKVHVLQFKTIKKNKYSGSFAILEKGKYEVIYEMNDVKISDENVSFSVNDLILSFSGMISENGFEISGEFIYENGAKYSYEADKIMDEHYVLFKDKFLK